MATSVYEREICEGYRRQRQGYPGTCFPSPTTPTNKTLLTWSWARTDLRQSLGKVRIRKECYFHAVVQQVLNITNLPSFSQVYKSSFEEVWVSFGDERKILHVNTLKTNNNKFQFLHFLHAAS